MIRVKEAEATESVRFLIISYTTQDGTVVRYLCVHGGVQVIGDFEGNRFYGLR